MLYNGHCTFYAPSPDQSRPSYSSKINQSYTRKKKVKITTNNINAHLHRFIFFYLILTNSNAAFVAVIFLAYHFLNIFKSDKWKCERTTINQSILRITHILNMTLTCTKHLTKTTGTVALPAARPRLTGPYSVFRWRLSENPGTLHFMHGPTSVDFTRWADEYLSIGSDTWQKMKHSHGSGRTDEKVTV